MKILLIISAMLLNGCVTVNSYNTPKKDEINKILTTYNQNKSTKSFIPVSIQDTLVEWYNEVNK